MFRHITRLLWVALVGLICGCQQQNSVVVENGSGLERVCLALNWFPEAEHGGFYAALVHGYFRDAGLEVDIRSGGPGAPVIQQVATGRVDFAVANADQVLLGRDQSAPVVAVMAALQESPHCIMVHAKSGIRRLSQLRDLTLAVGSGKPYAKYLLSRLGNANLTVVPYQGNVGVFLQREDYAQQAYVFSEPYLARQQGGDPRCLMISETGFNPYSSLLIASETLIAENPDLVRRVVGASVRGWRKYLEDPVETNRYIHQQNAEMSEAMLHYGAEAIRPLCLPEAMEPGRLGQMADQRWQQLAEQLAEVDLLENREVWRRAFTVRFLETR